MSILFSSQLPRRFKRYFIFHYNLVLSLGNKFVVVELSEFPESLDELLRASSCPLLCQETAGWEGAGLEAVLRAHKQHINR